MSDVAYAEIYAGINLAEDPAHEERRVQRLLAVNKNRDANDNLRGGT